MKSLRIDRLQQVIERAHLEGPQRVLIVRGDEDDHRHLLRPDRLQHLEPVGARHLDVQEDEIRRIPPDHRQPFFRGGRFLDRIPGPLEDVTEETADLRFVVDDVHAMVKQALARFDDIPEQVERSTVLGLAKRARRRASSWTRWSGASRSSRSTSSKLCRGSQRNSTSELLILLSLYRLFLRIFTSVSSTLPSARAKSVKSLPRPTFLPARNVLPTCRTMMLPARTASPPYFLTPRRWPRLSRPFRELRDLTSVPALISAMEDGEPRVREEALSALVEVYAERERTGPVGRFLEIFSDDGRYGTAYPDSLWALPHEEMLVRARKYPGFVAMKSFTADDGERLTVVWWENDELQSAWRRDARHREAQKLGRERWYHYYHIEVAEVMREQQFTRA